MDMRCLICLGTLFFILLTLNDAPFSAVQPIQIRQPTHATIQESTDPVAAKPQVVAEGPQRIIAILVDFPDKVHDKELSADKVRSILDEMDRFYREASYALTWIVATVVDKWYQVQTPIGNLDLEKWTSWRGEDMRKFRQEAIQAADNDVNYRAYDYVYIVAAGKVWPHGLCDFQIPTDDGMNVSKGVVVNESNGNSTYIHELAHVLPSNYEPWHGCGLPDLYSYDAMERDENPSIWVGPWDLMDNGFAFSAWSKIILDG